jgi:hypothetical protein
MSDLIQTLEAHEGKNPGEAIGTSGRSIVFLPKGVKPGTSVRVKLEEIREDSRGRMMYRGVPATVEYTEKWKNNGDGTVSRVTISNNWLLVEQEEGVIETRPAGEREVQYTTRTDTRIVWGQDLVSVEQTKVIVYHTQREQAAYNSTLEWVKSAEREQKDASVLVPITKLVVGYGDLGSRKLELVYQDSWSLFADAYYMRDSYETYTRENTVWGALPAWVQGQVQANYPVCSCGRSRRETNTSDGYGKCETCRAEEVCVRCGKQTKVANFNGRLVCNDCKPYEEQEQLVARCVTIEKREELAKVAETLLTVEALPESAALVILGATLDHVESEWLRNSWLESWKGYSFYFFSDQGVYATKLSSAALSILKFLPYAVGNQLVELVAWLTGRQKVKDCEYYGDFYHSTQVKGESRKPSLTESALANLAMAVRLRGSETDRQAVTAWLSSGNQPVGDYGRRPNSRLEAIREEVKKLMQASEQDYALALTKIAEYQRSEATRRARAETGEILPGARVTRLQSTRSSDVAVRNWHCAMGLAEVEISEMRYDLVHLEQEREQTGGNCESAEQRFLERELAKPGSNPVDSDSVFEVPGFERRKSPSGERLEYGPLYDTPSGTNIYLVLDPFSNTSSFVSEGERVLVAAKARSDAQLFLFKDRRYDPATRRDIFVTGYFVTAILAPEAFDSRIEEARVKLEAAEAHLAELKANPEPATRKTGTYVVDTFEQKVEDDEPETAMAEAFRRALQG